MAPPLQQPRADGAGSRGRDEYHAALVSSRKRPRVVAETHDDSVAFARAASLRASDYGAWLSESKTRWRSLRKKLALVRNFVELEANGDSLELGGILDPTGARAREKKKKRGFSRWKTVRAEEVRVGDIPQLTGDFKRLLAMLEANPATGGRAPTGDDGKETGRAEGAVVGANDADGADAAADDAGASGFAFEGERLLDSDDDLSSDSSESDDAGDADDSGDDDSEDDDRAPTRPEGDEKNEVRPGPDTRSDAEAEVGVEKAVPERSAADALAAYGDIDPPPPPPPAFAPPPGGLVNPHPAVARESRATLATLMPPPPPQPQAPRAAPAASGAAGALAAYGFDETPVFPQAPFVTQTSVPPPSHVHAHAALMHGARAGAFEDPWRHPAADLDVSNVRRAARDDGDSLNLREETAPRVARVSGPPQGHSPSDIDTARPFAMDDELRAAAALCAKPWLDLSVGDVETVLLQVKYLISRRRRAHKQGRAERRKRRLVSRAAETARAAAAAATGSQTVDADASTDPERADGSGPGSGSRQAGISGPLRLANAGPSADLSAGSPPLKLSSSARHTCVACDRVFDMPHKLRDHMHEHAGTAPHRCPFPGCDRAFANRSSLARHRLMHEKRHTCLHPGCGRHFPTAYALRAHERSHSEDRPFKCEVPGCGKKFKDEYTLVAHARVHTGEKRFACGEDGEPGCGKRFGYKVDLKRHRERCAVARGDE